MHLSQYYTVDFTETQTPYIISVLEPPTHLPCLSGANSPQGSFAKRLCSKAVLNFSGMRPTMWPCSTMCSGELTYPTKREKENHLQNAIFGGYVSSLGGNQRKFRSLTSDNMQS